MDDNSFAPGDVVSGLEPSELVEIQRVAPFGGKMLVEGVGVQPRRVVKRPLTTEEAPCSANATPCGPKGNEWGLRKPPCLT